MSEYKSDNCDCDKKPYREWVVEDEKKDKCHCDKKPCCKDCTCGKEKKDKCCDVKVAIEVKVTCPCGKEHYIKY